MSLDELLRTSADSFTLVEAVESSVRREEAFLDGVAGFFFVAQEPAGDGKQPAAVVANQPLESGFVPAPQEGNEFPLPARVLPPFGRRADNGRSRGNGRVLPPHRRRATAARRRPAAR